MFFVDHGTPVDPKPPCIFTGAIRNKYKQTSARLQQALKLPKRNSGIGNVFKSVGGIDDIEGVVVQLLYVAY